MHSINIDSSSFLNPIIDGLNDILPRLPQVMLILIVGMVLINMAARLVRIFSALAGVQQSFRQVISSAVSTIAWVFLIIQLLQALGFGGIITFFASSVLAIGLVMAAGGTTLVSDIVAGLFLARDPDFNVGDKVIVGETPTEGTIVDMDARRIRVKDDKGVLHIIPNSVAERKEWVLLKRGQGDKTARDFAAAKARQLGEAARKAATLRKQNDEETK